MSEKERPYRPRHTGFDEEATKRAQLTAERSRKLQAGRGEGDWSYAEDGPREAAERLGTTPEDVAERISRARDRAKRR